MFMESAIKVDDSTDQLVSEAGEFVVAVKTQYQQRTDEVHVLRTLHSQEIAGMD